MHSHISWFAFLFWVVLMWFLRWHLCCLNFHTWFLYIMYSFKLNHYFCYIICVLVVYLIFCPFSNFVFILTKILSRIAQLEWKILQMPVDVCMNEKCEFRPLSLAIVFNSSGFFFVIFYLFFGWKKEEGDNLNDKCLKCSNFIWSMVYYRHAWDIAHTKLTPAK